MLSEKLKELRSNARLTQEQVAEKINVTRSVVARWELAQGIPDISNLIAISDTFNISLDELIKGDSKVESKIKNDGNAKKWHLLVIVYLISIVTYIVCFVVEHHIFMIGLLFATLFMFGVELWVYFRRKS